MSPHFSHLDCRFCWRPVVTVLAQSGTPLCAEHAKAVEAVRRSSPPREMGMDWEHFSCVEEIGERVNRKIKQDQIGPRPEREWWSVPKRDYGPPELDDREREYDRGVDLRTDRLTVPDRRTRR